MSPLFILLLHISAHHSAYKVCHRTIQVSSPPDYRISRAYLSAVFVVYAYRYAYPLIAVSCYILLSCLIALVHNYSPLFSITTPPISAATLFALKLSSQAPQNQRLPSQSLATMYFSLIFEGKLFTLAIVSLLSLRLSSELPCLCSNAFQDRSRGSLKGTPEQQI